MADTPGRNWQKAGLHLLFFFRFIQLGSVTVTGFIYCYLVWHHNNHYCAYFPRFCTPEQRSFVKVPWEYVVTITACTLAFLESYISTISFLHRQTMPNYRVLLGTMLPVTAFIGFALAATHRSTSLYCRFLQIPGSVLSNVEQKNCVIVIDGFVSLCIATGFTAFIFLMSAIVVVCKRMRKKRIMLPLTAEEKVCPDDGTPEGAVVV